MKTSLIFSLVLFSTLVSTETQAKSLIGTVSKYIVNQDNRVIEIASNEIEDDGTYASYYDYAKRKRLTIQMSEVSKSTRESINDIQAGEMILVDTLTARNNRETINRYCEVFYLFENKKAFVGCKTYDVDSINGYATPRRLDFIISNVENVVAEISSLNEFEKGELASLRVDTENAKAGRTVKILAIFKNGEAIVQKFGFGVLDTGSIVYKGNIDRVMLSDLNKLEKTQSKAND